MELELGLKITHTRDDITSHSNLQLNKSYAGPLFLSRETDTIFFLIAYLKGFKRDNIGININEDGNRIAISGERAVQEMELRGYIMQRKDVELRAFRKVFQIPDGIILDKIKAKFNDKESSLTIIMPKSVRGMRGLQIEEVKEDSNPAELKETDEIAEAVNKELERQESGIHEKDKKPDQEQEQPKDAVREEVLKESRNEEEKKPEADRESNQADITDDEDKQVEEQESIDVERQKILSKEVRGVKRGSKLCPPFVVAGSAAILVSLVVLVISFIRAKRR